MNLVFEHDYQKKVMHQSFSEPTTIATKATVQSWRSQWMQELKGWHSPYKALIDCSNLSLSGADNEAIEAIGLMVKFFEGFFLKKLVAFSSDPTSVSSLPFEVLGNEETARLAVGLKAASNRSTPGDFRSQIQLQNHFQQHTVELTFESSVKVDTQDKINALRGKLMNNLMQWHSGWNLIIDCSNLEISEELHPEFVKVQSYLKGLFLKNVVGYSPSQPKDSYPFTVFRSRHKAAAELEAEGAFSGDEADCKSRSQV